MAEEKKRKSVSGGKKTTKTRKTTIKKTPAKKISAKKSLTKKTTKKPKTTKAKKITAKKAGQYFEAVGRRKQAVARVRLFTCRPHEDKKGKILVNEKKYTDFFPTLELQQIVVSPLKKMKSLNRFEASVKIKGGGIRGQAEALRHGLARTLVKFNPDFSKKLKRAGFLTRDARKKERKKPGLKKARRAPQWSKR